MRHICILLLIIFIDLNSEQIFAGAKVCDALANRAPEVQYPVVDRKYISWIHRDVRLEKLADEAGADRQIQIELNDLVVKYAVGIANPGIGSRNLGGGFVELRGHRGGRVIIKILSEASFVIVGKASKRISGNESKMFRILREIYPEMPPFDGEDPRQR